MLDAQPGDILVDDYQCWIYLVLDREIQPTGWVCLRGIRIGKKDGTPVNGKKVMRVGGTKLEEYIEKLQGLADDIEPKKDEILKNYKKSKS